VLDQASTLSTYIHRVAITFPRRPSQGNQAASTRCQQRLVATLQTTRCRLKHVPASVRQTAVPRNRHTLSHSRCKTLPSASTTLWHNTETLSPTTHPTPFPTFLLTTPRLTTPTQLPTSILRKSLRLRPPATVNQPTLHRISSYAGIPTSRSLVHLKGINGITSPTSPIAYGRTWSMKKSTTWTKRPLLRKRTPKQSENKFRHLYKS
jgi:hypothetical protein